MGHALTTKSIFGAQNASFYLIPKSTIRTLDSDKCARGQNFRMLNFGNPLASFKRELA